MMTRRKRILILCLIILMLFLLLAWLWRFFWKTSVEQVETGDQGEEVEDVVPTRPTISDMEFEEERETRSNASDVVSLAKSFVTRYGSYSNEAEFANLEDVLPLASTSFAAELQVLIDGGQVEEGYYGVTTSIVTVTVEEQDEEQGSARVKVTTQRQEAVGSPQNASVRYQDIILTFVKEDGSWKIDSAIWQ